MPAGPATGPMRPSARRRTDDSAGMKSRWPTRRKRCYPATMVSHNRDLASCFFPGLITIQSSPDGARSGVSLACFEGTLRGNSDFDSLFKIEVSSAKNGVLRRRDGLQSLPKHNYPLTTKTVALSFQDKEWCIERGGM